MKRSTSGHDTNAKRLRCNALSPRQHVYVRTIHISHLFGSHRPMKSPRNDSDIEWKSFWIWAFIAAQPVDWQRRRIGAWKPQFHGLARHTSRRRAPSDDSQMYDRGAPFTFRRKVAPGPDARSTFNLRERRWRMRGFFPFECMLTRAVWGLIRGGFCLRFDSRGGLIKWDGGGNVFCWRF